MLKKISLFLILSLLCINSVNAQDEEVFCGSAGVPNVSDDIDLNIEGSIAAPAFGPNGTLKALLILCKFKDDLFDAPLHTDVWPASLNAMPSWGPSFLSPTVQSDYPDPSISGYFHEMSMGNFHLIGDVKFYQPLYNQNYYFTSNQKHVGYLTEEILRGIDPQVNYGDYDSWDPNDIDHDWVKNEPDGQVDMIIIGFRFANTYDLDYIDRNPADTIYRKGYQGIAGLTGFQYTFGSGSQIILDGKIIKAATLSSGTFQSGCISPHDGLNIIAHELGHYIVTSSHYAGTGYHGLMDGQGNGVMSSFERVKLGWITPVTITGDMTNLSVPDAITTGTVYKLPIPSSNEYFLIDNHQRKSYYESSWRLFNGGPLVSRNTGIIISHCNSAAVDIESAFGRWNWKKESALYVFPFVPETPNPVSGEDKLNLRVKNTTQKVKNHPDFLGSAEDFFNMNYNKVFSPSSNPNTYKNSPSANSYLAVELIGNTENYTGSYIGVNVYADYSLHPAQPQNIDLSLSSNHPKLTWSANSEPNITKYEIYGKAENEYFWKITEVPSSQLFWISSQTYDKFGELQYYAVCAVNSNNKRSVLSDYKTMPVNIVYKENMKETNDVTDQIPEEYRILANYPNPFNPTTAISFDLPEDANVSLKVYDMLGAEVSTLSNGHIQAGRHTINFNGANLASGIYIYKFTAVSISGGSQYIKINKMMLLK